MQMAKIYTLYPAVIRPAIPGLSTLISTRHRNFLTFVR